MASPRVSVAISLGSLLCQPVVIDVGVVIWIAKPNALTTTVDWNEQHAGVLKCSPQSRQRRGARVSSPRLEIENGAQAYTRRLCEFTLRDPQQASRCTALPGCNRLIIS